MANAVRTEAPLMEESSTAPPQRSLSLYFGLLPVLLFLVLVIGLWLFPPSVVLFEPDYLVPIFNSSLFLAAGAIAYIALRSYLINGAGTILWLGCGVLTLGMGALAAGWLIYPFGPTVNAIFDVAVLLAAICHTGGVVSTLEEKPGEADPDRRRRKAALGYLAVLTVIALLVALNLTGIMPPFLIQGKGPTAIRQYVVQWALVLLMFASLAIMQRFFRKGAPFLYWYSLALALVAISMLAFFLQAAVGSPIGWVGRSSYVLAAVYFLISVNSALREARTRGVGLDVAVAELLGPGLFWQEVLAAVSDAVVSCDDRGRILLWNQAAARIFGYPEAEAKGKGVELILPDMKVIEARGPDAGITEIELKRQDGSGFSAEVSRSTKSSAFGVITTLVIRDVSARKRAAEALHRLNEELEQRVGERTEELRETVAQLQAEMSDRQEAEQKAAALGRLYRLLTRVYETIVHAQDQEGLFRQACRIMMEEGDFLLSWIGRVDWEAGLVRAAAQFDLLDDYPQNITISVGDVPEGQGPSGGN